MLEKKRKQKKKDDDIGGDALEMVLKRAIEKKNDPPKQPEDHSV